MTDFYQDVINRIENSLSEYRKTLARIDANVIPLYDFKVNYKNERSIAAFITYQLEKILMDLRMKDVDVMNELDIRINQNITEEQARDIESTVDQAIIKVKKKKFIPDTFATFSNHEKVISLFIEYKVNNSFKYIQLANDYIKFKHYSMNHRANPYFVYVLINHDTDKLLMSIKHKDEKFPKYQLIDSVIKEKKIDDNANVFIHKSEKSSQTYSSKVLNVIEGIDEKINKFDLLTLEKNFEEVIDFGNNLYFANMGKFGSRVLISNRMRLKYPEILRLYEKIKNYGKIIDVPDDAFISVDDFKKKNFENEEFINKLTIYFNNQISDQTRNEENKINNAAFNYSRKRSLWIQMLLQKFSEDIDSSYELIHFYNNKEKEDSRGIFINLQKVYQGKYKKNFNQLALGLIYYTVHLYEALFEITADKLEFKKEFTAYELKSLLIKDIKKYRKLLGMSKKNIEWDSSMIEHGAEILMHISNNSINR